MLHWIIRCNYGFNFSGFMISSSDTYQVLFGLSIVSSDDEPSQKANL